MCVPTVVQSTGEEAICMQLAHLFLLGSEAALAAALRNACEAALAVHLATRALHKGVHVSSSSTKCLPGALLF